MLLKINRYKEWCARPVRPEDDWKNHMTDWELLKGDSTPRQWRWTKWE